MAASRERQSTTTSRGGSGSRGEPNQTIMTLGGDASHHSFQLTSHKLDARNYLEWTQSVKLTIDGRGKLGHLTGEMKKPEAAIRARMMSLRMQHQVFDADIFAEIKFFACELDLHFLAGRIGLSCLSMALSDLYSRWTQSLVLKNLASFTRKWKRKFALENPEIERAELSIFGLWAYDTLYALAMAIDKKRLELGKRSRRWKMLPLSTLALYFSKPSWIQNSKDLVGNLIVNGQLDPSS
ncbi:hypothetical protein ACH5RR_024251 [Cinchona calisaya]|uniref:Retrotransposon Copia-like N-terminal domain-containing protein n=1 Tax=Cinchona calisaya TaxID=153742 RepID=A0ABD2YXC1_9GENT